MKLTENLKSWQDMADASQGAGMARYAAAMSLFKGGQLSEQTLEEFRASAKDEGHLPTVRAETEIRALVLAIEAYLDRFSTPELEQVRADIQKWRKGEVQPHAPQLVPACQNLRTALQACDEQALAAAIWRAAPVLRWQPYDLYPPEEIGKAFADNHAFASIMGESAPIHADDFDLGLFVIAPNVLYRDHKHKAPELYAPLTGPHGWRFAPGAAFAQKPAHEMVWNEPYAPHATLTGSVPFLCIFCWTSDVKETAEVIWSDDWSRYE